MKPCYKNCPFLLGTVHSLPVVCALLSEHSSALYFFTSLSYLHRHLQLSKPYLPPTCSNLFSVISLLFQNSPSECLPFSPNHFKPAVQQWFSFQLSYSNTDSCTLSSVRNRLPSSSTFPFRTLSSAAFTIRSIHQSLSQSLLARRWLPQLLFTLVATQAAISCLFSLQISTAR